MLTISWVGRNAQLQADMPIDHFDTHIQPPVGWQVACEFRYRATSSDPWGSTTSVIVTPPDYSASYAPPADGWVHVRVYSIMNGLTSWDALDREVYCVAGGIYSPGRRIIDSGEYRVADDSTYRTTG